VNEIKSLLTFPLNVVRLINVSNQYKKHLYCTKSPPQIEATAQIIRTLFFTAGKERPTEAPVAASKQMGLMEGYSG
ncbi:MAG TPA: hypothetical protein VJU52_08380, partial [Flavobacterium sp.]|nr:hypothetical protein [Flavobacterium sp.]